MVQGHYDIENPLKAATHAQRGSGVHLTVSLESLVGIFIESYGNVSDRVTG
jgi:hypothetical protein